jgi:hypothetical protein
MSSDESNADLLQELRRKFEAAVRLSRDDFKQELKAILKNAFFSYGVNGGKNNLIWVKDPEDPQSWKFIEGKDERDTVEKAIWGHLEFLAAAMAPHIRRNFKPVAVFARRWLLSDPFSEMLNDAPHSIITCLFENQDWLERLCKFFCYPEVAAIRERFQGMLAEELDLVLCDAELATASPLADQDDDVDASSAAEFEPAADPEDEVSETESESAGEASKRKADPEQLLAQRRELKRKLKDGKGLTKQEAAIYYNKTTRTIFDWCKTDGPLKVVKPRGRITAKSILDFPPEDDIDGPE